MAGKTIGGIQAGALSKQAKTAIEAQAARERYNSIKYCRPEDGQQHVSQQSFQQGGQMGSGYDGPSQMG